ncbi:MAG: diguanylate cyclase [Candidatus Auribacterota bacterium]|jgi:diguanylate cyclase (GGDEF)-like protein/PAS domain S-box-containing protein|uniref:diguanylate cyclase n=1 Tax=Candidatus Auribacter fodinae TaxID=2093366 RepID=A0A3A4QY64_9BACT|nr:MAG: diguanylate cyclase [Candidatus Auribacter fodinae]
MRISNSVKFITEDGIVLYNNSRITLFDTEAYQSLWQDMVNNLGLSTAREVFMRFGYAAGYCDALKIREQLHHDKAKKNEWLEYALELINVRGIGKIKVHKFAYDSDTHSFSAELEGFNTFEAEQHRLRFGFHIAPSCNFLSGYLSGFASMHTSVEIFFHEVSCMGKGDAHCYFIGKPYRDWPPDIRLCLQESVATTEELKFQKVVQELRQSESKYRDLFDHAPVMYFSIDKTGIILDCNATGCRMLGYLRDEIVGQNMSNFMTDYNEEKFWDTVLESLNIKNLEGIFKRKDKTNIYVSIDAVASMDEFGEIERIRCTAIDITQRTILERQLKEQNRILERINKTDPLTKLFNRRYLMDMLESEFEKADRYGFPLSVIIIDLDRFKQVNDYFGHQVGDGMLRKISMLIKKNVRKGDIAARFGGEEFVVVAPHTELNGAFDLAEKVRTIVEKEGKLEIEKDVIINITASFGVSCYHKNNFVSLNTFLQAADDALLKSKRNGRNRVMVSDANAYS